MLFVDTELQDNYRALRTLKVNFVQLLFLKKTNEAGEVTSISITWLQSPVFGDSN